MDKVESLITQYNQQKTELWKQGVRAQSNQKLNEGVWEKFRLDQGKLNLADETLNDTIDRELSDMVMREELTQDEKDRITSELW